MFSRKVSAANMSAPSPSMEEGWNEGESINDMRTNDFPPP